MNSPNLLMNTFNVMTGTVCGHGQHADFNSSRLSNNAVRHISNRNGNTLSRPNRYHSPSYPPHEMKLKLFDWIGRWWWETVEKMVRVQIPYCSINFAFEIYWLLAWIHIYTQKNSPITTTTRKKKRNHSTRHMEEDCKRWDQ